jgi:predicted ester cyclase
VDIAETNRRVAETFHDAFNRGDLDAAASCFAEDCRNHGRQVRRAGVRKVLAEIKTNFPDARLTTLNSVAEPPTCAQMSFPAVWALLVKASDAYAQLILP